MILDIHRRNRRPEEIAPAATGVSATFHLVE